MLRIGLKWLGVGSGQYFTGVVKTSEEGEGGDGAIGETRVGLSKSVASKDSGRLLER